MVMVAPAVVVRSQPGSVRDHGARSRTKSPGLVKARNCAVVGMSWPWLTWTATPCTCACAGNATHRAKSSVTTRRIPSPFLLGGTMEAGCHVFVKPSEEIRRQIDHGGQDRGVETECHQRVQAADAAHPPPGIGDIGGLGGRPHHQREMHKIPIVRFTFRPEV